jgi:hypothetical protein
MFSPLFVLGHNLSRLFQTRGAALPLVVRRHLDATFWILAIFPRRRRRRWGLRRLVEIRVSLGQSRDIGPSRRVLGDVPVG